MARRCQVCGHPQREDIDAALRQPHSIVQLARDWDIERLAVMRHRQNHLTGRPQKQVLEYLEELREAEVRPSRSRRAAPVDPQTAFLTSYAAGGDLKESLKTAGVTRPTLRKWQEHDEDFVLRFHQAETEAIETLEAEARIRAVAGSRMVRRVYRQGLLYEEIHEYRPSDSMLVKLLQAHKPEKYGDKLTLTQTTVVKAVDADAWNSV